jgi:DnaJ family protein B protein 4
MAHKTSSESSISLDSFVHMVASGSETHTTPTSSRRESLRTSWKQGVRQPSETIASQYRNNFDTTEPRIFHYEAPSRGGVGPAMYRAPTPFAPATPRQGTKLKGSKQPNADHPAPSSKPFNNGVNTQYPKFGKCFLHIFSSADPFFVLVNPLYPAHSDPPLPQKLITLNLP